MIKDEESIFDSISEFSMESDNYDQLLAAFKETHDEANRLAVICSKLQNVNNFLAPKVKSLEEELHEFTWVNRPWPRDFFNMLSIGIHLGESTLAKRFSLTVSRQGFT